MAVTETMATPSGATVGERAGWRGRGRASFYSGMAPLGHFGRQPAPEVALAEAWDVGKEGQAQARLEVASDA